MEKNCTNCAFWETEKCHKCTRCYDTIAHTSSDPSMWAPIETDNVNHPSHYATEKYECIDVMLETQGIEAAKAFCLCNAFKYLWRHKKKNGVEDVKKAIQYLNKYVELE